MLLNASIGVLKNTLNFKMKIPQFHNVLSRNEISAIKYNSLLCTIKFTVKLSNKDFYTFFYSRVANRRPLDDQWFHRSLLTPTPGASQAHYRPYLAVNTVHPQEPQSRAVLIGCNHL